MRNEGTGRRTRVKGEEVVHGDTQRKVDDRMERNKREGGTVDEEILRKKTIKGEAEKNKEGFVDKDQVDNTMEVEVNRHK
ncbi:hypothetical protein Pmani_031773 [Petrolisthes manimaculis]|uniref:Uncharacterized protein n=1 Tax=Petrolisthes manimaculis TaxID=1843537 RepID=A0AAE1TUH5_9EUCA|nr:hypothetical protein Pmani_031773 [Petrolisthes manimaculis]